MKLISFLRTTWRKKEDKPSTKHDSSPLEQTITETISVSIFPKISFGKRGSILTNEFNTAAQGQQAHAQETPSSKFQAGGYQSIVTENLYRTDSDNNKHALQSIPPFHHAPSDSSYGSSHNFFNGPSTVTPSRESEWENDPLSGRSTTLHPPRPPFLTPWSHSMNQGTDSVSVSRSPPRVKFSPEPQRPSLPDFPSQPSSHHTHSNGNNPDHKPVSGGVSSKDASTPFDFPKAESCCSHESESIYSQESALSTSKEERRIAVVMSDLDDKPSTNKHHSAVLANTTELNSSSLEAKYNAGTVIERSDLVRNPPIPYHSINASPPLLAKSRASQTKSVSTMESSLPLSPAPSPLFIRKRPKPLVLPPTPTAVPTQLPPSPAFTSIDSTPPSTPRSYSSASRQHGSPSPMKNTAIRTFHRMSPPTTSPPSSPLPTPPCYDATSALRVFTLASGPRTLHGAQSTTELRDLRDLRIERRKLASAHGTTSSRLISGIHFPGDDGGRRSNSGRPLTATYLVRLLTCVHRSCSLRIAIERQSRIAK